MTDHPPARTPEEQDAAITRAEVSWLLDAMRERRDETRRLTEHIDALRGRVAAIDQALQEELIAEATERRNAAQELRDQARHWRGVVTTAITEVCGVAEHGLDRLTGGQAPLIYALAVLVLSVGVAGVAIRYHDLGIGSPPPRVASPAAHASNHAADSGGGGSTVGPKPQP